MNVKLVSDDRDLHRLCRETMAGISGQNWQLSIAAPEDGGDGDGDLWLWDYSSNTSLPQDLGEDSSKYLFLVQRKDLPDFHERVEAPAVHILLKPVTGTTLATFLEMAGSRHTHTAVSLRSDRDEILQCLIQTNLRLQEYDQDRTTFLARAVHDFRAPLTALNGYCGLLLDEPLGPLTGNQREVLRRMQNSTNRLSRMAAAMFQLSVGRQVKQRPDLHLGDIRECLGQALHEINPFADEKRISITADLSTCDFPLFFETGQIEQVLINILDNACKFTPRGGTIEIRGYPYFWERRVAHPTVAPAVERRHQSIFEPNAYRMDIRDSGMGIAEEHLQSIFEEYTSYGGGRDRSGGGLGLAITKMIVTQHDGGVWAENTRSGTMFSFVLPAHRREPGQFADAVQRPDLENERTSYICK